MIVYTHIIKINSTGRIIGAGMSSQDAWDAARHTARVEGFRLVRDECESHIGLFPRPPHYGP